MTMNRLKHFAGAFAVAAILASKGAIAADPLPVEAFASLPSFSLAKLSPDGKQIGYMTEFDGRKHLVLQNLDGSDRLVLPPIDDADIMTYHWANNERVLIVYELTLRRYEFRDKSQETRLMAINRDGSENEWIVKSDLVRAGSRLAQNTGPQPQFQHIILDMLPDEPNHIIMSVDANLDARYEVRKVDIRDGHYQELHSGSRGIQNWYMDHGGTLRLGTGYDKSEFITRVRDASGSWVSLHKTDWFAHVDIEGFTDNPNVIYVSKTSQYGTRGLYKLALDRGEVTDTVFEHEKVDIDHVILHPVTNRPIGVAYTLDRQESWYFDTAFSKIQAVIDRALKSTTNTIVGKAKGQNIYLVFAKNSQDPGVYYWLDLTNGHMSEIAPYKSDINPAQAASVRPVTIPVRDGSSIPGYLTLPKGKEDSKDLPAVVMPHGGPLGVRDTADWDWWAQFLANRGYAVLQPNYRGSGGYGGAFENAGRHQWGGLMQNDVTDATRWLIETGIAHEKRICIIGASYGGYAALMGSIMEPELYQCAASVNGVTDLPRLKSDDRYGSIGGRAWTKTMGLEGTEDKTVSPYHRLDELHVPVLFLSSKDDARIDYHMSETMHKKLLKKGKESTYVKIKDGGHHMDTANSREVTLRALEPFLAKHIGN